MPTTKGRTLELDVEARSVRALLAKLLDGADLELDRGEELALPILLQEADEADEADEAQGHRLRLVTP